jgi:hypothetical protein
MKTEEDWGPLTRAEVEEEIQRDRIREVMERTGRADPMEINRALSKTIDWFAVREKWKVMKNRKAAQARYRRRREVNTDMLKELRGLDIERTDLDEMVALSAFGRDMKAEYERLIIPIPEWLEDRLVELDRETRLRRTDALEKKLKELRARKETLKTAEQKRQDVDTEMAKIEAALGKPTPTP